MSKHELHEYPNLVKAVDLLDESNYTPGQLIAYDKYMDSIITWNSTMIESFDNGFDDGFEKGMKKGTTHTISIIQALKKGESSVEDIAKSFNTTTEFVQQLKVLL